MGSILIANRNFFQPYVYVNVETTIAKRKQKTFQLATESNQRLKSGDVAGKFVPKFGSRTGNVRSLTVTDEPRRWQITKATTRRNVSDTS